MRIDGCSDRLHSACPLAGGFELVSQFMPPGVRQESEREVEYVRSHSFRETKGRGCQSGGPFLPTRRAEHRLDDLLAPSPASELPLQ